MALETESKTFDKAGAGISNTSILGDITWLLSFSDLHKNWPIGSIQQWVFPAILHGHFRIYRRDSKPHGYVSWAWLSKEVEEAYVLNTSSLQPKDWKSGQRGWLIDYVAPFGGAKEIAHDLKYNVFPDEVGRFLRIRSGDDTMRIGYIHGANAIKKSRDWTKNPTVEIPVE